METTAADEVVGICRDLLRIDTTNTGDPDTTVGERAAAEYVAGAASPRSASRSSCTSRRPGRANLVARIPGADPRPRRPARARPPRRGARPTPSEWSVPPFAGEEKDGYLWGRGAIDMKDFDAMMLAVVRRLAAHRLRPAARHRAGVHRRRGGGHGVRLAVPGPRAPRPVRRLHRGDRRGRRLLVHGERRPAPLPGADRREGPRLAAAARHRPARARLVHPRRQRGHRAGRGRRPGRPAPVPDRAHPDRAGLPGAGRRRARRSTSTRTTRSRRSPSSARSPTSSAPPSATPPTRPGSRRATRTTSSPARRPRPSTAAPCPARPTRSWPSCAR